MASIAAEASQFVPSFAPPSTLTQWRVALQELKLLYVQKQYKRCVARSSSILAEAREPIHPVHKTYLYFYSAVSYEAMGRYAHEYSSKKVSLLREALDCFGHCLVALPAFVPEEDILESDELECEGYDCCSDVFWDMPHTSASSSSPSPSPYSSFFSSTQRSRSRSTSPTDSIVTSITDIIEKTLDCPGDDPFLEDYEVLSEHDLEDLNVNAMLKNENAHQAETEHHLIPSPLQVRKPHKPLAPNLPSIRPSDIPDVSTHTEPLVANAGQQCSKVPPIPRAPQLKLEAESERLNSRPSKAYNSNLQFLHNQVTSTITALHVVVNEVTATQQARAASRRSFQRSVSFWSFSPVKNDSKSRPSSRFSENQDGSAHGVAGHESKQQRIVRLRSEGWETVGLRNATRGWKGEKYYQEFCAEALDELYLV